MLMGLNLPLPKHIVGHGWWLVGGEKGSKSKGNIPTPHEAVAFIQGVSGAQEALAVDSLRYYLLRDISFTGDSEFSYTNFTARYNGELANDLGNLLNRTLNMLAQYEDSVVPDGTEAQKGFSGVAAEAVEASRAVVEALEAYNPPPRPGSHRPVCQREQPRHRYGSSVEAPQGRRYAECPRGAVHRAGSKPHLERADRAIHADSRARVPASARH